MKKSKTLDFFEDYDFENQNNQEQTDVNQTLGGEIWYNYILRVLDIIFYRRIKNALALWV